MLHKKTEDQIDPNDIWQGDVLNRQVVADEIIQIISTIKQPFVIGMSSRYGTGKTFFAKRCIAELEKRKYAAVYFDAWQNDYAKEPLTGFVHTITKRLTELCGPDDVKDVKSRLGSVSRFIAKRSLPLAARLLTRLTVGEKMADELADEIERGAINDVSGIAEKLVQDSIDSYDDTLEEMETFKTALSDLAKKVREENEDIQHDQVIVFVDELDRCRPDYTIEILESIKHLFNVEGFIFVLMSDDEAFDASIASVYSEKISADHYLRKFVDWKVHLPDPTREAYTEHLANVFNLTDISWLEDTNDYLKGVNNLKGYFTIFAIAYKLTLREMDQCFTTLNLALRSFPAPVPLLPIVAYLTVLKAKDQARYNELSLSKNIHSLSMPNPVPEELNFSSFVMTWILELGAIKNIDEYSKLRRKLQNSSWEKQSYEEINIANAAVNYLLNAAYEKGYSGRLGNSKLPETNLNQIFNALEALNKFHPERKND